MTQTNLYEQKPKFFCFGNLKPGTRPKGGESKRSGDNFGHFTLFRISDFVLRIYSGVNGEGKANNF